MFGWIITKDYLETGSKYEGRFSIGGQSHETQPDSDDLSSIRELRDRTLAEGKQFRLYDDDKILYYDGLFLETNDDNDSECEFAPLDWARNNDGCVRIDYLEAGKWETL